MRQKKERKTMKEEEEQKWGRKGEKVRMQDSQEDDSEVKNKVDV